MTASFRTFLISTRRRGSIYLAVLGYASLLTVIGPRAAEGEIDLVQARMHAHSAIEKGLWMIENDPVWRTNRSNGNWAADQPIATGTYTLEGIDPNDGNLTNSPVDPLVLTGTGLSGAARHKTQVTLVADIRPLEALKTCLHAAGDVAVLGDRSLTVTGAPLSTNGTVINSGTIYGDVEAASVSGEGTITGTVTTSASPKELPDPGVFDLYASMATSIPFPGTIDKQVLTPGYNPWGAANADGVYFIDAGDNDLVIQSSRIHGTLVVKCGIGRNVILHNAVFLHSYRPDYPVLIVDGNVELVYESDSYDLLESDWDTSFNPSGAAFQGGSDNDRTDVYPNEVQGLVHVKGTLLMKSTARVRGVILCESTVTCEEVNEIIYEPSLYENPPLGYTLPPVMKIADGSWKQVVD